MPRAEWRDWGSFQAWNQRLKLSGFGAGKLLTRVTSWKGMVADVSFEILGLMPVLDCRVCHLVQAEHHAICSSVRRTHQFLCPGYHLARLACCGGTHSRLGWRISGESCRNPLLQNPQSSTGTPKTAIYLFICVLVSKWKVIVTHRRFCAIWRRDATVTKFQSFLGRWPKTGT